MYFESLLDAVLGERQIFHIIECPVCGFEEIYYEHCGTKRLIGKACRNCNFVQKFEQKSGSTRSVMYGLERID
ncbi:acyltransferase [Neobacillus cucumis]|uniref:acyltransferase n=1 Tax=Neobacillus cucumis TaxID=1740721 RepID=UPI00285300EE|nr:acyltransferase [Neobacillus cucumis]MDR4949501.1 acyltransferase [Neobacillus cucumis]